MFITILLDKFVDIQLFNEEENAWRYARRLMHHETQQAYVPLAEGDGITLVNDFGKRCLIKHLGKTLD